MQLRRASLFLSLIVGLAACSNDTPGGEASGDDSGGDSDGGCTSNADCTFGLRCVGGECTSLIDPPLVDQGCVTSADCSSDEQCAPSSGRCVPVAEEPDPTQNPPNDCTDGETRPCGSKVGACEYGAQSCVGGVWDATCVGGISATVGEICNGADDDCNGDLPRDEIDLDGDGMTPCAGDCDDTDPTVYDGAPEACNGTDNNCNGTADDGTDPLCDDGVHCNGAETCQTGACTPGAAPDCSGLDDQCNLGACEEATTSCVTQPRTDGTSCDDGLFCTVNTTCTIGSCGGGSTTDCSSADGQCNVGVCNEGTDQCDQQPANAGNACDDGAYCNVGETCQAGTCTGGSARVCSALGSCQDGTCDETTDACEGGVAINEGLACDDGQFCTEGETCQTGVCTGSTPLNCADGTLFPALNDDCNQGVCNDTAARCEKQSTNEAGSCDDGQFCTSGDTCSAGTCLSGGPYDCSSQDDQCNLGTCNEASNTCIAQPANEGVSCVDGLFCQIDEVCVAGACTGSPQNCSLLSDECNTGICDEAGDSCVAQPRFNGTSCSDDLYCSDPDTCQGGVCIGGPSRTCSAWADLCNDGVCNEGLNLCESVPMATCACDPAVDADFDTFNECDDCDDTNGGVYDGAPELCNGIDDDCDSLVDEDFDIDGDFYSVCAVDPTQFDCNDNDAAVNPGATESCDDGLGTGTGNGIDDDCDGYIDEGCNPCDPNDTDGDGVSECEGDCMPGDGDIAPGRIELCDDKDNDCNIFTTENCEVSDPCNFDVDFDYSNDADICQDNLECLCIVNAAGNCTGNYRCTSYCNWSETGPVGDGCAADEACSFFITPTANLHGCSVYPGTLGTLFGGVSCSDDSQCRSGNCAKLNLSGQPQKACIDFCGSDDYCPANGTICRLDWTTSGMNGRCWPVNGPYNGSDPVGTACNSHLDCDHGYCPTDGGSRYCTEPCCQDADCPNGFTCSLNGNQDLLGYMLDPAGRTCAVNTDCPSPATCLSGDCVWDVAETSPMCLRDASGQETRPAGAACAQNSQCRSNYCEAGLSVCVEVCCNDTTCPNGLTCEVQMVQTTNYATWTRMCMNQSISDVLRRK